MCVRATLRLRNDALIRAREALGLSQKQAARKCRVPLGIITSLEAFRASPYTGVPSLPRKRDRGCGCGPFLYRIWAKSTSLFVAFRDRGWYRSRCNAPHSPPGGSPVVGQFRPGRRTRGTAG